MKVRTSKLRSAAQALWIVLALSFLRVAYAEERIAFDIPSGPAKQTLLTYFSVTGLQLLYGFDDARDIRTNEVRGMFTPTEALAIMTKGTRLRYELSDETVTLTVEPADLRKTFAHPDATPGTQQTSDRRSLFSQIETATTTVTISGSRGRSTLQELAAQMTTLTRTDIEAFGFATTQDVIRTLPQIFGGGPSEDTRDIGFEARTNAGVGTGVNLRGLGAGSTLVLVNGRRLAGSGSEGIFIDISSIPLSVVDRIEILPDNASSVYGADAVGGVVNFVLMDSFQGAQTEARYGAATRGDLKQERVSQLFGTSSERGSALFALDFYSRDALAAADRAQARSDLTGFGGSNFDPPQANPGTITFGGNVYGIPRGQDGTNLQIADLIPGQRNTQDKYLDADLLPAQQRWSLFTSGTLNINDSLQIFADARFTQRNVFAVFGHSRQTLFVPASNSFNPFPGPVQVGYDLTQDLGFATLHGEDRTRGAVLGADWQLDEWHLRWTADYANENLHTRNENAVDVLALQAALGGSTPATAFNPFGDGSHTDPAVLESIRGTSSFAGDADIATTNVTASRSFASFQESRGRFVAGADFRRQSFRSHLETPGNFLNTQHSIDRQVSAAFAAASIPLLGKRSFESRLNTLEASLAARYENYSDFGHIITPRYGLTWSPFEGIAFRSTFSNSFRPPNLVDLDESTNVVSIVPVLSPAGQGSTIAILQSGKNAALREERAKSWTAGMDFESRTLPLSAAVTYFRTTFRDRMNVPVASTAFLIDPIYADVLTVDPTPAERAAVCNSAPILVGGTREACLNLPIGGIVDLRVRNSALMRTDGIDLLTKYTHESAGHSTTFRVDGTYLFSFSETQSSRVPLRELVSTQNNPIDFRLRASVDWSQRGFRVGGLINYFDNYRDVVSIPQRSVSSWTTVDLNLAYSTPPQRGGPLAGMTFSLNADNVFDAAPPFLNNTLGIGYDQENGDLLGRIVSVTVRKNW